MIQISAKMNYACRALLELALHWPNVEPLQIELIAQRQNIPVKFLIHILIHLKQAGLLESVRGKGGGYRLNVAPKDITLKDVMKAFDEVDHLTAGNNRMGIMQGVWKEISGEVSDVLGRINFEHIVHKQNTKDKLVSFEI